MDRELRSAERAGDASRAERLRARGGAEPLDERVRRLRADLERATALWRARRPARPGRDPAALASRAGPPALAEASRWFGADGPHGHGFRLARPLSPDRLSGLEERLGVALPAEYRAWLGQVAGGGAGPCYGVLPPSRWGEHLDDPSDAAAFAAPCLLDPARAGQEDWDQPLPGGARQRFQGTLAVCEEGCAYHSLLILTGPHRGRVARVAPDEGAPFLFADAPDFLAWYEAWLQGVLAGEQANA